MALLYITGAPGVGKTTIQRQLSQMGIEAYDIDTPQFGGPYNIDTGERVVVPPFDERDPDWFSRHEWRVDKDAFHLLKRRVKKSTIIVCGVAESDKEIIHVFDKVIYLYVDNDTLKKRLSLRTDNDYGKNAFEVDEIISRKEALDRRYLNFGFNIIDASGSLDSVVEELRSYVVD